MKYFSVILSVFILLFVSTLSHAQRVKVGDWTVDHGVNYNEAYIENSRGQSIGFWCSTEEDNCFFYLRMNSHCDENSQSVVQVKTEVGVTPLQLLCHKVAHEGDYHYLQFFADTAQTKILLEERHYIEMTLPETGQSRFSLKGSKIAIRTVADLAGK